MGGLRIALDVTPAVRPRRTGVGWYAAHLAGALEEALEPDETLLLCTRLSRWRWRRARPTPRGPRTRQRWLQDPFGPRGAPDVFHGSDARLPGRTRAALVATVHDVFSLESDRWALAGFRERKATHYRDIARRAARIVFPSHATRRAYLARFPEAGERTAVIHEGVEAAFAPQDPQSIARVRRRFGLPERYALYVGEISLRKNLAVQGRALVASGTRLPWVWVGMDSFGAPAIETEVRGIPGLEVVRTGYLPREALPAVYAGAKLLTFATSSEGFGLPALEAMACGTPAVVADRGALPEIAGGCALEADPDSPEAIADAIRRLVEGGAEVETLRRRGLERARDFRWSRAARETLALYREVAAARE